MNKSIVSLKSKKNSGSSLVTVIVIIAFMSILATISLYISGANYHMKVADYATRKNFYDAEKVVELFYSSLMVDVSKAAEDAYQLTGCQYVERSSVGARKDLYYKNFKDGFEKSWKSHWSSDTITGRTDAEWKVYGTKEMFPGATNVTYSNGVVTFDIDFGDGSGVLHCVVNSGATSGSPDDLKAGNYFAFKDALDASKYTYSDDGNYVTSYQIVKLDITVTSEKTKYTSQIVTSFMIVPPDINWSSGAAMTPAEGTGNITKVDFSDCVNYYEWSKL